LSWSPCGPVGPCINSVPLIPSPLAVQTRGPACPCTSRLTRLGLGDKTQLRPVQRRTLILTRLAVMPSQILHEGQGADGRMNTTAMMIKPHPFRNSCPGNIASRLSEIASTVADEKHPYQLSSRGLAPIDGDAGTHSIRHERARSALVAHVSWLSGPRASGWGIGSARPDSGLGHRLWWRHGTASTMPGGDAPADRDALVFRPRSDTTGVRQRD